ncbi:thymidine phosphorylase [Candidatus Seribacter sulfatis]|uniref:thymidine phosphorylase n=1 Tax=Candidatus Seribacter sulfatis TaxID=3381756 RepID=UPI00389AF5E4
MNIPLILSKVRDGMVLSTDELSEFARGLVSGTVSDAQAGAFAMAVCVHGLSEEERVGLTLAMRDSGNVQQWDLPGPVLDKHSTGGIGDNVSLILAPALAACGAYIPMISGRGLGHTGGTLDKLESIPGYRTLLPEDEFQKIVADVGCAIVGAGQGIAPADKRLYAIRDVTSTVESIDLITASILSKKLAAGLEGLILDVKVGNGAFISDPGEAKRLARSLVDGANGAGCKTSARLTDMEQPLARAAGNALECRNALEFLNGVNQDPRLREVTLSLGGELLCLGGLVENSSEGETKIDQVIGSGQATERFARMVFALGGPNDLVENYSRHLPEAPFLYDLVAKENGFISEIDLRAVGQVVIELGGGRKQQDEILDLSVGLDQISGLGQAVQSGDLLCRIHAKDEESAHSVSKNLLSAFTIDQSKLSPIPVVGELVQ